MPCCGSDNNGQLDCGWPQLCSFMLVRPRPRPGVSRLEARAKVVDCQLNLIGSAAERNLDLRTAAVFDRVLQSLLQHAIQTLVDALRQAFRDIFGGEADLESALTRDLPAQGRRRRCNPEVFSRGGCKRFERA